MTKLRATAQAMRQGLDWCKQTGKTSSWNMRTLPRGLQMLLSYQDEQWRLALRREGVAPSEEEISLCLAAFDVPDTCGRARRISKETKYHQTAVYHIVELTWREYDPLAAALPGPGLEAAPQAAAA
jgi:hypothetical protein